MPGADAVSAWWNSVNAEGAIPRCLRIVRMIEHSNPGVRPGMLLAHDFDLRGLLEPIDWNHFPIVVERRHARYLSGPDIDQAIGVHSAVVVGDVERAVGRDHLNEWIQRAAVIRELEAPLEGKSLSASDVEQPDHGARDTRA